MIRLDKYKIIDDEKCVKLSDIKNLKYHKAVEKIISNEIQGEKINETWFISKTSLLKIEGLSDFHNIKYYYINELREFKELVSISKVKEIVKLTRKNTIKYINDLGIMTKEGIGKGNKSCYITKSDFEVVKNRVLLDREYYYDKNIFFRAKDAKELFGMNTEAFLANRKIQSRIKKPKIFLNNKYFYCSDIDLIKDINRSQHVDKEIINYSINKVCKELMTTPKEIEKLINTGVFSNSTYEKRGKTRSFFISQKDIDLYKKTYFFKFDENYEKVSILAKRYGVKSNWLIKNIDDLYYIGSYYYSSRSDVEEFLNIDYSSNKKDKHKKNKYSIYNLEFENIARSLYITNLTLFKLIQKGEFPLTETIEKDGEFRYILNEEDIERYKKKYFFAFNNKYCAISDLVSEYGYYSEWIRKNVSIVYKHGNKNYCLKSEGIKICEEKAERERLYNLIRNNDKEATYKYYFNYYRITIKKNDSYSETLNLFDKFIKIEINKSKSNELISIVHRNGRAIIELCNKLEKRKKELFSLNSFELEKLLFEDIKKNASIAISLGKFTNFVRLNKKDECKYDTTIRRKATEKKEEKIAYNHDLFMKYAEYVLNYSLHINYAIDNPKYAQIWLYSIFHFCTAWRSSDILSFPSFPEGAEFQKDILWFKDNKLNNYECELIINMFTDNYFVAHKTNNKIIFQVFKPYKLVFSTVLLLCEKHRVENSEEVLFYCFKKYRPDGRNIKKFLEKSDNLPNFTSIGLNRSFISNYYEYTSSKTELHKVAYFLSRKLRGHVTNDMTAEYINSLPIEDINKCSLYIFENETFGYIKHFLAELLMISNDDDYNTLSIEEKRDYMINKYKLPNVLRIEAFSKTLLLEQQLKINIVDELLKYNELNLLDALRRIYIGVNPSYINGVQCLNINNCPNTNKIVKDCEICKYAIFNKQFLYELNKKIFSSLQKIITYKDFTSVECKRKIVYLQRLLIILRQALDNKIGLGIEVVESYINLNKLKEILSTFIYEFCKKIIFKLINDLDDLNSKNIDETIENIYSELPFDILNIFQRLNNNEDVELLNSYDNLINYLLLKTINYCLIEDLENDIDGKTIEKEIYLLKKLVEKISINGISNNHISSIVEFNKISWLLNNKN